MRTLLMTNKDKAIKIGSNYPATECVKKKYRFIESESDGMRAIISKEKTNGNK